MKTAVSYRESQPALPLSISVSRQSLQTAIASQGYAWDQAALARLGAETQMGALLPANVQEMDALLFGGGVTLAIPDVAPQARQSLPPWERME